jgi:chemotaxis protein MotA
VSVKNKPRRRRARLDIAAIALAPAGVVIVLLSQVAHGAAVSALFQTAAALIVFGGTLGAVLLTYSPTEVIAALRAAAQAFRTPEHNADTLVATLVTLSIRAHRRGVLALDAELEAITEPFLREGLTLTIDGTAPDVFQQLLAIEKSARDAEEEAPARVFEAAAGYAPTMGILGAVLGLMRVMENISAPGQLGAGIAVAFVATVYGVGIANLVLLPLAGRLRERAGQATRRRELIAHGLEAIHQRLSPRLVARKLRVFSDATNRIDELAGRMPPRVAVAPRLPA